VNVDEDSDVDILEASSPTPLHQNPYSSYSETGFADSYAATPPAAPSTPPFPQAMYAEPMDYQQTHSTEYVTALHTPILQVILQQKEHICYCCNKLLNFENN